MARILVVDDTKNIRNMVALTLKGEGHEVQVAEDGQEGLQLFNDGSAWDLTVVDQRMPELSGDEFVAQARQRDPMARLIMMTAFATVELASEMMGAGVVDFLRKPFSVDVLRGAVAAVLATPRQALRDSEFNPDEVLPQPGEANFSLPSIAWRMNGFSFWPSTTSPTTDSPQGFELGRLFQVRHPDGNLSSCFVGITPHVQTQIEAEVGCPIAEDDLVWIKVCGQALLDFLSEKAQIPPSVLTVYERPHNSSNRRAGLAPWGPFGGK